MKTADSLTVLFLNRLHITCVIHELHRVYETIGLEYSNINYMINV